MNSKNQYTLWQILGIWFMAGAPMWILSWVAYPALSAGLDPLDAGLLRMKLLIIGLVWQFVLSMIILYREEGNIRLGTISLRFWLNHPKSARSGETKKTLLWWLIPLIVLYVLLELGLRSALVNLWTAIFPFFAEPAGYDFAIIFTSEMCAQLIGAWGLFGWYLASGLLAKFCNKFETCQWFFRCDFKRDFNATNECIVFNSLHYLSNRPLVRCSTPFWAKSSSFVACSCRRWKVFSANGTGLPTA